MRLELIVGGLNTVLSLERKTLEKKKDVETRGEYREEEGRQCRALLGPGPSDQT